MANLIIYYPNKMCKMCNLAISDIVEAVFTDIDIAQIARP